MDVGYSHVQGNSDRGYGQHHRSWVLVAEKTPEQRPLTRNSPKKREQDDRATLDDQDARMLDISSEHSDCSSSVDGNGVDLRTCVSCNPADVLLNLEEISRRVFQYLPMRDLQACMSVSTGFRNYAISEEKRRHVTFLLSGKMEPPDAADFLGKLCYSQYEEVMCEPKMIFVFKIRILHPPGYRGDVYYRMTTLLESDVDEARKAFSSHLIKHQVIIGDTVVSGSANSTKFGDSFCAMLIPSIKGLLLRCLYQMNFDHALRFGHFTWMQNCMDDIAASDLHNVKNRGYLLITSARVLGMPEPLAFDFPFCGISQGIGHDSSDNCFVFCGPKVRAASIFLDHNVHHGKRDLIVAEMEKVGPSLLKEDAVDTFAICMTNRTSLLNYLYLEEAAVFRQMFPRAKLSGCSTTEPFFGNTASTVCITSTEDRTIRASNESSAMRSSISQFFIVVVHR